MWTKIKDFLYSGIVLFFTLLGYMMRIFPINPRKVIFVSYFGKYYNDNPKAVSEKLAQVPGVEIVWVLNEPLNIPNAKCVKPDSLRYFYEMATAKVWVDNGRKPSYTRKRKGQYYLQLWHGNLGLKRIEAAAQEDLSPLYIRKAQRDSRYTDLITSASTWFSNTIRNDYWYDGEILECGSPRLDRFLTITEAEIQDIKANLAQPEERIFLYAPTFRNSGDLSVYEFDYAKVLAALTQRFGGKWRILLRLHPNMSSAGLAIDPTLPVSDATKYPDLYEIICAADFIVSDYSSLLFDAAILNKQVLTFAKDVHQYQETRPLNWRLQDLPFPFADSSAQLVANILEFSADEYFQELEKFLTPLGVIEPGNSAQVVSEIIQKQLSL